MVEAIERADKAGIDCPFGWPERFVSFVTAHRDGPVAVPEGVRGIDWRRDLAYRTTDRVVYEKTGRWPLSVSADRIGHTAMRCAHLLARLGVADRAGAGRVAEVYPAASLRRWGLLSGGRTSYKRGDGLGPLVDGLKAAAPWLDLGAHEDTCRTSHDVFDAVVAALTARAAWKGTVLPPAPEQAWAASREGWIALPDADGLGDLVSDVRRDGSRARDGRSR